MELKDLMAKKERNSSKT